MKNELSRSDLKRRKSRLPGQIIAAELILLSKRSDEEKRAITENMERWRRELALIDRELEVIDSKILLETAERYGLELQPKADWWSDEDVEVLSNKGRYVVRRLVRDERRRNIEWWVRVVSPFLGYLVGLMGLLIALLTILGRWAQTKTPSGATGDPTFPFFPF